MTPTMIFKKIGMVIVYYFLMSLVDTLASTFLSNYTGGFIAAALLVIITTYALRVGYIKNLNLLQEQRDEYNASFKNKFFTIIKSPHFKLEMILGIIVSLIFMVIPRIALGMSYFFAILAVNRAIMLILTLIFVIVDFVIWYLAYWKCFKKKKY